MPEGRKCSWLVLIILVYGGFEIMNMHGFPEFSAVEFGGACDISRLYYTWIILPRQIEQKGQNKL